MYRTAGGGPDFTGRREFLRQSAALLSSTMLVPSLMADDHHDRIRRVLSAPVKPRSAKRPRIAAIYTELRDKSHAFHIIKSHLGPYLFNGELTDPGVDIVSWYADQFPQNDMTREAAVRLNMPLYDTIAGALTCGTGSLAVDGVLLIGEHGSYPRTDLGQVMYPRKEFFDQIVSVMDQTKKYVPIFNDKHLSYRWDWAKEMYDTAREKGIPFMAGSSVPLSQRTPDTDLPLGAKVTQAVSIHGGPVESYDFHGVEVLQSIVERRQGGETGVASVQLLSAEQIMASADRGEWSKDLANAAMRAELGEEFPGISLEGPHAVRHGLVIDFIDGLRGVVLSVGGGGDRWNFACNIQGQQKPLAIRYFAGPWGNRNLFRALSHAIQEMFITGEAPYPVERTLLSTGIVEAGMKSHHTQGVKIETPHLNIAYQAKDFSAMRERGRSWEVLTKETPLPRQFEPGDIPTLKRLIGEEM